MNKRKHRTLEQSLADDIKKLMQEVGKRKGSNVIDIKIEYLDESIVAAHMKINDTTIAVVASLGSEAENE